VAYPVGITSAAMVLGCLAVLEREPTTPTSSFAGGEQRRQLELLPAAGLGPAELSTLNTKWARPSDQAEAVYFRKIAEPNDATVAGGGPDSTIAPVEAEVPGSGDSLRFRWREGIDGTASEAMPPPVEEPQPSPPPPPPPRPEPSVHFDHRPEHSFDNRQAADVYDLHADVRDLVRMSRTMLDTLAAQLKQNEESARLVTGHLGSTESQLATVAERLRMLADNIAQPPPVALDAERLAHGLRRVEARLQALVENMERQGTGQPDIANMLDQTATLKQKQSDLAALLSDIAATQQAMQVNLGALRNEQLVGARSIQSDLSTMAVQAGELRQAQGDFTATLSEQAAALRSMQADIAQAPAGPASFDRHIATLTDAVRRIIIEELHREGGGPGIDAAVAEQASALRSLQGDLTHILSDQAAAIRSLQASATNEGVGRADLDQLRTDLFANQERQFANIVGVIRTLLHDSDELVLAMGRVPKADRAGRAFDMLRLSGGSGWEGQEPQS
jgi:hypothetical protein